MAFPRTERVIYENNPLVSVICQLRFPDILRIAAELPADFQDRIRDHYPIYSKQGPRVISSAGQPARDIVLEIPLTLPPEAFSHQFRTEDSKRIVSLAPTFVALADVAYTRYEEFRAELEKVVNALLEVYGPAFLTRIGLRYQNEIVRSRLGLGGVDWRELLNTFVVGELGFPPVVDDIVEMSSVTLFRIPEVDGGQLRLIRGLARPTESEEPLYRIDADFFRQERTNFDDVFQYLEEFHRLAGCLFRWAISEKLHNCLGPRAIRET